MPQECLGVGLPAVSAPPPTRPHLHQPKPSQGVKEKSHQVLSRIFRLQIRVTMEILIHEIKAARFPRKPSLTERLALISRFRIYMETIHVYVCVSQK